MSKNRRGISSEKMAELDKANGVKVIDVDYPLIEYAGKNWRPIKDFAESLCAAWDNEPTLMIGESQWVNVNWKS